MKLEMLKIRHLVSVTFGLLVACTCCEAGSGKAKLPITEVREGSKIVIGGRTCMSSSYETNRRIFFRDSFGFSEENASFMKDDLVKSGVPYCVLHFKHFTDLKNGLPTILLTLTRDVGRPTFDSKSGARVSIFHVSENDYIREITCHWMDRPIFTYEFNRIFGDKNVVLDASASTSGLTEPKSAEISKADARTALEAF